MKSKDHLHEYQNSTELEDLEEDKFDSIDLRNSKVVDSSMTEENKLGTVREENRYEDVSPQPFGLSKNVQQINHSYFKTPEDPTPEVKGYLLCVRCGHNGNFNIQEKALYEKHLANAGFITLESKRRSYL